MLTFAVLLIAVFADKPKVETVCATNHCEGTKTNPIPRGVEWASMGILSTSGCCFLWNGPCEQCIQPFSCVSYKTGQNDDWCKEQAQDPNSGIVFGDSNPETYVGCGCPCCRQTDTTSNLPKNTYPTSGGTTNDITIATNDATKAATKAAAAGIKVPGMEAAVKPESLSTFDWAVNGFAAFGLAVVLFGAYKHYSSKQ